MGTPRSKGDASKPRLLVIAESLGIGGTESHLIRTLPPLVEEGFNVAVICLSEPGARAGAIESRGIDVLTLSKIAHKERSSLLYPAHVSRAANRLYWLMRRLRPHIVHFYLPGPYLIGAPIAIASGVPVKIMSRRCLANYQRNWPLAARVERRLHAKLDAAIGNSRRVARELIGEGIPEAKVRLIYNLRRVRADPRSRRRAGCSRPR
jgi:hypothetical protein